MAGCPCPYIGITDFTNVQEVEAMVAVFDLHKPKDFQYKLHAGVMMSYKTLHGLSTKFARVFPRAETIRSIFDSEYANKVMYCLHYADSKERSELWKSLSLAMIYGGSNLHALQLDLVWPCRHQIFAAMTHAGMRPEIILQIGKQAFEEIGNDPEELVDKLIEYAYDDVVHHVLLDKSEGRGIGMDAEFLMPFIEAIQSTLPGIGVGVAGGLGPDTFQLAEPVIKKCANISTDMQSNARKSGNILDPVEWDRAGEYLIRTIEMIKKSQA